MKIKLLLASAVIVGTVTAPGTASAWKCDYYPEKPNCTWINPPTTTTNPPTTTTTTVPETTTTTHPTTTTTTTTTEPPEISTTTTVLEHEPERPRHFRWDEPIEDEETLELRITG